MQLFPQINKRKQFSHGNNFKIPAHPVQCVLPVVRVARVWQQVQQLSCYWPFLFGAMLVCKDDAQALYLPDFDCEARCKLKRALETNPPSE